MPVSALKLDTKNKKKGQHGPCTAFARTLPAFACTAFAGRRACPAGWAVRHAAGHPPGRAGTADAAGLLPEAADGAAGGVPGVVWHRPVCSL